jgi:hypothetical protein
VRIPIEYRGAPSVTKPFEPNEMKEIVVDMLDFPEGAGRHSEHLRPGVWD